MPLPTPPAGSVYVELRLPVATSRVRIAIHFIRNKYFVCVDATRLCVGIAFCQLLHLSQLWLSECVWFSWIYIDRHIDSRRIFFPKPEFTKPTLPWTMPAKLFHVLIDKSKCFSFMQRTGSMSWFFVSIAQGYMGVKNCTLVMDCRYSAGYNNTWY
jgi:hypothetical protein